MKNQTRIQQLELEIKQLRQKADDIQNVVDELAELELNAKEVWGCEVYSAVVQWMKKNPEDTATGFGQDKSGHVHIYYTFKGVKEFSVSWYSLGWFSEHPGGWENSYHPLPFVPPVEQWPEKAKSFFVTEGGMQVFGFDDGATYIPTLYPLALVNLLKFDRPSNKND